MPRTDSTSPPSQVRPSTGKLGRGLRDGPITFLMLAASIWLFIGAWVIGYPFNEPSGDAHLTEMLVGIVVFCVALARLIRPRGRAADLIVLAGGVWLVVAPFALSYGDTAAAGAARVNDLAVGSALIALSLASLALARGRADAADR
ncbi:SPW repeat protein [Streptomyces sp. CC210A]|uniref:SPW repeat domain-containing protein n=1 Tax=Streptomyces sp. CC210A TaxID=2898184 RepID=UPI001F295894|nr:SPW repeat protein [Streptomyces sp. CC210A]